MLNKEEKEEMEKDLTLAMDIQTLAESNGGKKLVKSLQEDILTSLGTMIDKRSTATLQEFIASTCDIKTKLDIIKVLAKAKTDRMVLETLLKEIE